ncbi:RICIN domain-containing protein [Kitasatospora misakiensis]|uniref:RICIN domain-containing protein n=1 Tax=Kitasatospora misakiensis TaxID=67330 RepID=A0ABW0WYZ0_9ACTN
MTRPPSAPARRLGAAAAALAVAGTLSLAAPATARTTAATPVEVITANPSGTQKCLDVTTQSTENGARVQQWTCNGGANQQWYWTDAGELVGVASGKCLDIPAGSTDEGVQAIIWTCNGGANQKWTQTLVHHAGVYTLTNANSGLNLDVRGGDPTDGTPVVQSSPQPSLSQWWFYGTVPTARG